ncbi:unnamed protein product [Hymenolepis diminuta]|uniref:Ovule protein n=1 Tax=Hymenolepis diminuta TaxID=6216 RepID=A0A0R3SJW5_HYMDI|nr:unnamed protein product [Hymenolepis diminuta]
MLGKCEIFSKSVTYYDLHLESKDHVPDSERTPAILDMASLADVQTLRSFQESICYYNSFLPCLHKVWGSLNRLLQNSTNWCLSIGRQRAFVKSNTLLTHYYPVYRHSSQLFHGCHFTLSTEYKPLLANFRFRKGVSTSSANSLQHWTLIWAGRGFQIKYRKKTEF